MLFFHSLNFTLGRNMLVDVCNWTVYTVGKNFNWIKKSYTEFVHNSVGKDVLCVARLFLFQYICKYNLLICIIYRVAPLFFFFFAPFLGEQVVNYIINNKINHVSNKSVKINIHTWSVHRYEMHTHKRHFFLSYQLHIVSWLLININIYTDCSNKHFSWFMFLAGRRPVQQHTATFLGLNSIPPMPVGIFGMDLVIAEQFHH